MNENDDKDNHQFNDRGVKRLVRKIDAEAYQQYDKFPIETKKLINNKWTIDILNGDNSWDSTKYFIYEDNNVRKIIKKSKDTIMITTFDGKNQPHIDIIKFGENNKIEKLIKIDARKDGYDYMEQIQSLCDTITMYERHGNTTIETRFFPSSNTTGYPGIEIRENTYIGDKEENKHIVNYTFGDDLGNPTEISLMTNLSYKNYRRDKETGLYSLNETKPFSFLTIFGKKMSLDKLEKKLKVKYSVTDRLVPILQKAIDDNNGLRKSPVEPRTGLECPEELRKILYELSVIEELNYSNQDKGLNVPANLNNINLQTGRPDSDR